MKNLLTLLLLLILHSTNAQIIPYDSTIERSTINFSVTGSSHGFYYSPSFQKCFKDYDNGITSIVRAGIDFKLFNSDLDYLNQHRVYIQTPLMKDLPNGISAGVIPMWFEAPLPKPSYETYGGTLPDGTVITGSNPDFFGYWTPSSILITSRPISPTRKSNIRYELQVDKYWGYGLSFRFRIQYEVAYLKGI